MKGPCPTPHRQGDLGQVTEPHGASVLLSIQGEQPTHCLGESRDTPAGASSGQAWGDSVSADHKLALS